MDAPFALSSGKYGPRLSECGSLPSCPPVSGKPSVSGAQYSRWLCSGAWAGLLGRRRDKRLWRHRFLTFLDPTLRIWGSFVRWRRSGDGLFESGDSTADNARAPADNERYQSTPGWLRGVGLSIEPGPSTTFRC